MNSKEIWQMAYLIALARGNASTAAVTIANKAVDDWEDFERDTA